MATSTFRNKNLVRPKKTGAKRRRRRLVQKRRLIALGAPEADVAQMTTKEIRDLLKRPKETAARYAG